MVSSIRSWLFILVCCIAAATAIAQITPEEIQKIDQAIPTEAMQKPSQPRKLLVFTRSEGFKHDAIPYAAKMLELMGKKTGAFEIVVGDEMALFKPESLRRFDAVCFDNTTQLQFEDASLRTALLDFVRSGKGLVGIHAATDNFPTWPEAQEMIGGTFDNHPWTSDGTWKVTLEDPDHPLMTSFKGQGFSIKDEIYRIKQVDLRKHYRVLMGLDTKDEHNRSAAGVRNSDKDIPISWLGNCGKGRVFYCSLGHNREVYWNPAVVRHYLAGIQYALGDFQADATPRPFNSAAFFDQNQLNQLLKDVSSYTYGKSKQPLQDLDAFIRFVSDITGAQEKLEQQFLALLRSEATPAGKQFICSRLGHIGTGASVPTLSGMLADSTTWDMAMYALEYLPGGAVDDSLCHKLSTAQGRMKCGIVNALGRRRASGAVPLIQPLLSAGDRAVALAAAGALAEIGNPAAIDALAQARKSASGEVLLRVLHGSIKCAERLATTGEKAHALQIYNELQTPGQPVSIRVAALRGIVLLQPESAGTLIVQAFQDTSSRLRSGAMQLVREVRDTKSIQDLAARIGTLPADGQAQLISALDVHRDPVVFKSMLDAAQSKNTDVRTAAIKGLGKSGEPGAVGPLVSIAASGSKDERTLARDALDVLSGPAVNDSIVALLAGARPLQKTEALAALSARHATAAVPSIIREAGDRDPSVRVQAAKSLKALAQPADLPPLLGLLTSAKQDPERKEWETTVIVVAKKETDPARRGDAVLAAYESARDKKARVSLLTVLGKIDAPSSLEALRKAVQDSDPDIRICAIRGLAAWPTSAPTDDLWNLAQNSTVKTHRALALRGVVRLLGLESTRPAEETVSLYKRALALAPTRDERKGLLASMADAQVLPSLQIASGYIDDKALHTDAELVTVRISENVMGSYPGDVVGPLQRVTEKSSNPTAVQRAKELLSLLRQSGDFLTTWEYAGPYMKAGAPLFWTAFPPEEGDASVQWKLFPAGTNPEKPWLLDFKKVLGGEDRVVYVRNRVWSDSSRKAVFEIGTDDGVKLWLNGALVHSYDVERLVNPGDDTPEVTLQQGWNIILMKVNQRVNEWGACVKLRAVKDAPKLQGIRVARVSE